MSKHPGGPVTPEPDGPVKDHGSFGHSQCSEDDIAGHHRERWQDQAMYIGLRYPKDHQKRRRHRKHPKRDDSLRDTAEAPRQSTPPSQRVQFLLGREDGGENGDGWVEDHKPHEMFCELEELREVGEGGEKEWKETARWIKFEEDVEEGGERWSKPHVATLSLHSLFELRKGILCGTVMLDMDVTSMEQVADLVLDHMVAGEQLDVSLRSLIQDVLLTRHRHQYQHQRKEGRHLPGIRSMADIGRKPSEKKIDNVKAESAQILGEKMLGDNLPEHSMKGNQSSSVLGSKHSTKDLLNQNGSESGMTNNSSSGDMMRKYNEHFLKKIPPGAEASNILVGEVPELTNPVMAFVRLSKAQLLADLTEVPVPTRFIFILLGPAGHQQKYHEIGRSIATLMTDEIFHDVAYKARDRNDLLSGIDEFLDCVTVLPPGEWDPTIRIEPPKSVPSQDKRKKPEPQKPLNGMTIIEEESKEEEHGDPNLKRTGRLFGGLIDDIKRKVPWYLSDIKDGLHVQCLASFFFMYFACLTPIITFGGLLGEETKNNIAAMESLVSGAICGISYHLFAGQPLTIIGSTGPVLVFESIVFKFCTGMEINYLCFRFWIGMWIVLILVIIVMFDLSALVRFITRFTEECFAMLIAVIFMYEAFKKLFAIHTKAPVNRHPEELLDYNCTCVNMTSPYAENITEELHWNWTMKHCDKMEGVAIGSGCDTPHYISDVFFFSCLLFIGTFALATFLKSFRNTRFFPNQVRVLISDFAVFSAIVLMVLVDFLVGLDTPKLDVPDKVRPTLTTRGWIVDPFANHWYWAFAAFLPSILAGILIFMDQQITAVIVNRKENKLRKGNGYHLDMLVIAIQIGICSLIGTPWFVAATVMSINHIRSLTRESDCSAPGERPKFLGVREQRMTGILVFLMVGLSALMARVLKFIPMPVLFGVFLYMGVSSLKGIQFVQRVMILFMPSKYQPDYMFLRNVPVRRVHLFTLIQVICFTCLWVIKQIKQISIVFPLMVLAMCFIRKGLDWVFSRHELIWLDDIMPEPHKREKADKHRKKGDSPEEDDALEVPMISLEGVKVSDSEFKNSASGSARDQLNISEEMSKTGIWQKLNSESSFRQQPSDSNMNGKNNQPRNRKSKSRDGASDPPVKFIIEDDDEDDSAVTTNERAPLATNSAACPDIVVEPPPYSKLTDSSRL